MGYVRCAVSSWDDDFVYAQTSKGSLRLSGEAVAAVRPLLWKGMQLNVFEERVTRNESLNTLHPQLVVVEPDFLMDVTAVAACFAQPGMHPLSYTLNRLKPRPNSQAILLGNFAGAALDDIIAHYSSNGEGGEEYDVADTLWRSFREQAMQFCACDDFDGERFVSDARQQAANLEEVVSEVLNRVDVP